MNLPYPHRPFKSVVSRFASAYWRLFSADFCIQILHTTPRGVVLSFCYSFYREWILTTQKYALLRAFIVSTRLENVFTAVQLTCDYQRFQLHEVELQTSIRTEHVFGDLLHITVLRPIETCIVSCVQPRISEGHADLASSTPSSPVRGQSRLTYKTGNVGCVRYPTEGNNSSHELTTAMHHLINCLATTKVSSCLQLI